jgi:Ca2+/Na+ antiporter
MTTQMLLTTAETRVEVWTWVVILVVLLVAFIYLYAKYNEESSLGRQLKSLQQSYQQFGDKTSKLRTLSSLELGKKISEKAKATKAKVKPSNEFVNPHPMVNNNNVITASM